MIVVIVIIIKKRTESPWKTDEVSETHSKHDLRWHTNLNA